MKRLSTLLTHSVAAIFFTLLLSALHASAEPHVELFSPQGTVKGVRQAVCRFSDQMVPIGLLPITDKPIDMLPSDSTQAGESIGTTDPFDISCPEKGKGRWVDGRNWVYDFERDLPAGVKCEFRLKQGLKTLAGEDIQGQTVFTFSTGGPSIIDSIPYEGYENCAEDQAFILMLDAEPTSESVLSRAAFSIEGLKGLIGVAILEGEERDELLKSIFQGGPPAEMTALVIQAKQRFPSDAKVTIVWGKGVSAQSGVLTEQDQVLSFKTRPPFIARFHCERENPRAGCIPIGPMVLEFSAPVPAEQAKKIVLKSTAGKSASGAGSDAKTYTSKIGDVQEVWQAAFEGPFPENTNFIIELPKGLKDIDGRRLSNADKFPLSVRTGQYPPLAKFSARFGIVELKAGAVLPVTLRNLEPEVRAKLLKIDQEEGLFGKVVGKVLRVSPDRAENIQPWLRKVAAATRESSIFSQAKEAKEFKIPKPGGPRAFEVVGIPLEKPGFYVLELESAVLGASLIGEKKSMYVPAAVLVTNLAVHFKWGRETSLVWVTTLDRGEPVKGASVSIRTCDDKVIWKGKTDANGIARVGEQLPSPDKLPSCDYEFDGYDYSQIGALDSLHGGLFITAQAQDDISFAHSSWNDGIEPWRFNLPYADYTGPSIAHTIFDRTLLRAGETVHMKHIVRRHASGGFNFLPKEQMPDTVTIVHLGSEQSYSFQLEWDQFGTAETAWQIPRDARLGSYDVMLSKSAEEETEYSYYGGWFTGSFRVEEFRVPLMKAVIQPPREPLVNPREVSFQISVQYLAGGGAGDLPVRMRSEMAPMYVPAPEGFEDFVFSNGAVREGTFRGGRDMETEEGFEGYGEETATGDVSRPGMVRFPVIDLTLDRSGFGKAVIKDIPKLDKPNELLTEAEFMDPNGEIQTASSTIPLYNSKYLIGIKPDSWALSRESLKFQAAVLDVDGKPVRNAPVKVHLLQRKLYSHRKRLVGGFYAYEHVEEISRAAELCSGKTDSKGRLLCETKSPVSGNLILQAETTDENGNTAAANTDVWVAGKDEWWFDVSDHDRIDLLPEKKRYEPGETAKLQVRMPFREAAALVTVEREGVMEAWVKKISGKEPLIEVPVKGNYAPNVFISVLAVRGRVSGVNPTAIVDLGKPAYKLGISQINVGFREHELNVKVSTDKKVYKVREKAKVAIKVTTPDGKAPPKGSELAIAAVDEGLLELMPNESWDILRAMMGERGYEVETSTAQMHVVGKRHFGLKALPQGGGGGRQVTRELFDTLLLWKGRLPLDAKGEAFIDIPLNDSLTGFRIVAVAHGGPGFFGSGQASIRSTQDLMILSGLPPLVREGDTFKSEFTLRNTTEKSIAVEASAQVQGLSGTLKPLALSLGPNDSKLIGWDVAVPAGVEALRWEVSVTSKSSQKSEGSQEPAVQAGLDRIRIEQKVVSAVPVRTYQAVITQVERELKTSVQQPAEALPGRGGVSVSLKPKIVGSLEGVRRYMKQYPYTCMEQKVSRAVALRDEKAWEAATNELPAYLDSDGLVKYFPTMRYGSPVLTAYIISIADEGALPLSDYVKEQMSGGLIKFVEGSLNRDLPLPTADLAVRKLQAVEALSRDGGAQASLLASIPIEPKFLPTSAVLDWLNILINMQDAPNREKRLSEAEQILRSRLTLQGTSMGFSSEDSDRLWWLMVSGDLNAVRLILTALRLDSLNRKWKDDMPRLIQWALSRQRRGAWDLTTANAWGVLAMEKFSGVFEAVPAAGKTLASLGAQTKTLDWKESPSGTSFSFPWPAQRSELSVMHQGSGRPWVSVQSLAAIPLKAPLASGYTIKKTITPVEQKLPGSFSRGDVLRIKLELEAQSDQTWVVVSDPLPAGATILGSGLGRDSRLLTAGEEYAGWIWPVFEERSFEAFRAYYEYVPKGAWSVEYTIRLNQSGAFQLPTARVESLYYPEMFGELPNDPVTVQP